MLLYLCGHLSFIHFFITNHHLYVALSREENQLDKSCNWSTTITETWFSSLAKINWQFIFRLFPTKSPLETSRGYFCTVPYLHNGGARHLRCPYRPQRRRYPHPFPPPDPVYFLCVHRRCCICFLIVKFSRPPIRSQNPDTDSEE